MLFPRRKVSAVAAIRQFHSERPNLLKKIPSGCVFAPFQKSSQLTFSHSLDDEYYLKFLKKDLPRYCIPDVPEILKTTERMINMISYNVPSFHTCWTFPVELIYKTGLPQEKQNVDGLLKSRILRASIEMKFSYTAVLDDIIDGSEIRRKKHSWKLVGPNKLGGAICDGLMLYQLPYYLINRHFATSRFYVDMLEALIQADFFEIVGSMLDLNGQGVHEENEIEVARQTRKYKAGGYLAMQADLGMLNIGIEDKALRQKVKQIFALFGDVIQSWDDFCDYYCSPEQTGKPSCDFVNGGITWASATALTIFTEEQKNIFQNCYKSKDPTKIETVKKLYDAVDLPGEYVKYMRTMSHTCKLLMKDLQDPGMEETCKSLLEWLLGDV